MNIIPENSQTPITEGDPIQLRPTVLRIDLGVLETNLGAIRAHVGANRKVMAVVKSNAYGHGLLPCARLYERCGVDYFGVAYLEEGIQLRQAGIKTPILVLGGILNSQIHHYLDYDIDILASSVYKLEAIEEQARLRGKRARVHVKIDTGMERVGVHYYSATSLLERLISARDIELVGISSHFARQEEEDLAPTRLQLERFLEVCRFFEDRSLPMPMRHIAATGAILQLPESHLEMVRPGALLYGIEPEEHLRGKIAVRPALSLSSTVVYFKVVKKGAGVSYSHTWVAPEDTRVITIPIGYGDGFSRRLSNKGSVLLRDKRYPIVGRVCMDQMMVDIGKGEAHNGDEVILVGSQGQQSIRVEEIAELVDADPREILVHFNLRIPRKYIGLQ